MNEYNDYKEFNKIKRSIALKCIMQILVISLLILLIIFLLIDGIFNDELANTLSESNIYLYYLCVKEKEKIILVIVFLSIIIVAYFIIKNAFNKLTVIIRAMNKIINNPQDEIKLSEDLLVVENRLNNIRVELINRGNEAKISEQKKNDLIMYMAHDLKTPLTSIIGYLTLLNEEENISKKFQDKYIKIALDKALRVEELTNEFFEITKYNLEDIEINKKNIDLVMLLKQLKEEFYPSLIMKNIDFIINSEEKLEYIGDGDKLARAFSNIIKNAINYGYPNSEIIIDLNKYNNKIEIIFKNKGDKIPKYKLDKLFDKFYRAEEARESITGGTGLGLAIAKEIIMHHNGNIYVKNDTEYIEFHIELFL